MLRALCLFVFLLAFARCFAVQDNTVVLKHQAVKKDTVAIKKKIPAVVVTDTTTITRRILKGTALNNYKKLPEFQYNEAKAGGLSWWTRFWMWFWHWLGQMLDKLFGHSKGPNTSGIFQFLKYLVIAAGLSALVFLILKLSGINLLYLFRKRPYTALAYTESVENIHEIDFEAEIEKTVSAGNYRLAVRLLYLRSLKQLSDNGLIDWQISKTNTNYLYELNNNEQREAFRRLTLQFEYVWYGDFAINSDIFKRISALFNTFKSSA